MSSSFNNNAVVKFLSFIIVAMAYHACLWQLSVPSKLGEVSSVSDPVLFKDNADVQSSVGSISQVGFIAQTGKSLGEDILEVAGQSVVEESTRASNDLDMTTEMHCLAMNIYFEARSESVEGQLAVGHVVMNRVSDAQFPNTVCEVIHQGGENRRNRCQFSWWCDGKDDIPRNKKSWLAAVKLAHKINNGWTTDPTGGALWYHATYVQPYWRRAFAMGPQIGRHIFYRYA